MHFDNPNQGYKHCIYQNKLPLRNKKTNHHLLQNTCFMVKRKLIETKKTIDLDNAHAEKI